MPSSHPTEPKQCIWPKKFKTGDNTQGLIVYGEKLKKRPIRTVNVRGTSHQWTFGGFNDIQNEYLDMKLYPARFRGGETRHRGTRSYDDLTITLTFDDGSQDKICVCGIECDDSAVKKPPRSRRAKTATGAGRGRRKKKTGRVQKK